MPDITMCRDHKCPRNWACHRYTASPSMRQPYFPKSPRVKNRCKMFMENSAKVILDSLIKAINKHDKS
jgi:hypothetical protein